MTPGRKDHGVTGDNRGELLIIVFEVSDPQGGKNCLMLCGLDLRAVDTK